MIKNIFCKYKGVISMLLAIVLLVILSISLVEIGNYMPQKITLSKSVKDSINKVVRLRHAADSLEKIETLENVNKNYQQLDTFNIANIISQCGN